VKRAYSALVVVLLTGIVFSQISCSSGGFLGGGGGAGIQVGVASPGTKVSIDGHSIGTVMGGKVGPVAYVAPGQHTLTAQVSGYEPFEMQVYAYPGRTETYDLPLISDMKTATPKK
jgi:hypothetical protein